MFDTLGNYLYCCSCISAALGVCKARLTCQRNVKRLQSQKPIIRMTKEEVEDQRLGEYVIMPDSLDTSFKNWWRAVTPSTTVEVRYPHERHGKLRIQRKQRQWMTFSNL